MTARRAARAERIGGTRSESGVVVDGHEVPAELFDRAAPVWHDRAEYLAYCARRSWQPEDDDEFYEEGPGRVRPPSQDRFRPESDVGAHPENRRRSALEAWAVAHGITHPQFKYHPDRDRLHSMGLLGLTERKRS